MSLLGFFKSPELTDSQIKQQLDMLRSFPLTAPILADTLDNGWAMDVQSKRDMKQSAGVKTAEAYTSNTDRTFHFHRDLQAGDFKRLAAHECTHGQQQEHNPVKLSTLPLVQNLITYRFREAHADTMEGLVCHHHWRVHGDKHPWDRFKNGRFEQARTIGLSLVKHQDEFQNPDFWQPDNPAIVTAAIAGFKAYFTSGQAHGSDYVAARLYEMGLDKKAPDAPQTRQDYAEMLGSLKVGTQPILGSNWQKVLDDPLLWPIDHGLAQKIVTIEAKHPGSTGIDLPEATKLMPSDYRNVSVYIPSAYIPSAPRL